MGVLININNQILLIHLYKTSKGFSEVYLIGMDFSYSLPESTEIEGCNYTSQEDDPNHFHPDYFGKGKKWHDPQLDRVLLNYQLL